MLSLWCIVGLHHLALTHLVKKFTIFIESKGSLPFLPKKEILNPVLSQLNPGYTIIF
jgi:hypothetical protein